jgi:hypothetical protein
LNGMITRESLSGILYKLLFRSNQVNVFGVFFRSFVRSHIVQTDSRRTHPVGSEREKK